MKLTTWRKARFGELVLAGALAALVLLYGLQEWVLVLIGAHTVSMWYLIWLVMTGRVKGAERGCRSVVQPDGGRRGAAPERCGVRPVVVRVPAPPDGGDRVPEGREDARDAGPGVGRVRPDPAAADVHDVRHGDADRLLRRDSAAEPELMLCDSDEWCGEPYPGDRTVVCVEVFAHDGQHHDGDDLWWW